MAFTVLGAQTPQTTAAGKPAWLEAYRDPASRLIGEAVSSTFAWDRLSVLTDTIGNRLSGTPALDRAIQWAVAEMNKDGLENVHTEHVMVPKWVRGSESAEIVEPARHAMVMLGLGDSVGTTGDGIQAEVLVVDTFDELDAKAASARGRIVLFNVPFTTYGETVRFRSAGPSRAARHGAVAMLVRAVGPAGLRTPHTGALQYASDARKIPAAAISSEDADRLAVADRGSKIVVRLKMEAHVDADAESANVVGEIRGRERPDEVVVVSGHLDSWDVGAGATDDGGGCVVTWEALRIMKKLNLRPRRTVRVVLWTNEENGGRGGLHAISTAGALQTRAVLSRTAACSGRRLRVLGNDAARDTGSHRELADLGRGSNQPGRRRRRHRAEHGRACPACRSRWTDRPFSHSPRRPTRSTRSIRWKWPSARRVAVMACRGGLQRLVNRDKDHEAASSTRSGMSALVSSLNRAGSAGLRVPGARLPARGGHTL
jgi:carboxypeptidase Q